MIGSSGTRGTGRGAGPASSGGWGPAPAGARGPAPFGAQAGIGVRVPGIRRFGASPGAGRRYTRRPGVYAVLLRGDRVLLTCQFGPRPDFQLPGGGVEPGESPLRALVREVAEETGWRIAPPRHVGTFRRFTFMPEYDLWAEKVCAVFLARPTLRIGAPTDAGHGAVWMPVREAAGLLGNPGDAAMLRAVLARGDRGTRGAPA